MLFHWTVAAASDDDNNGDHNHYSDKLCFIWHMMCAAVKKQKHSSYCLHIEHITVYHM